jgi:hypothetical protein
MHAPSLDSNMDANASSCRSLAGGIRFPVFSAETHWEIAPSFTPMTFAAHRWEPGKSLKIRRMRVVSMLKF